MKYKIKDIIESQDYNKIPSRFLFKYFFIPTAWPITLILLNLRISANQATLIRLIIHLVAFFFILIKFSLLGYILIYVAIIFDCVDGQIARTKKPRVDIITLGFLLFGAQLNAGSSADRKCFSIRFHEIFTNLLL